MAKVFNLIIIILLSSHYVSAQEKYKTDSLIYIEFQSDILAEKRRILVHLPLNYFIDSTKHYPVMYVLDGTSQDQHTYDKIAVLADGGLLPHCLVVGVPNSRGNRNRDQTPPFMKTETDDSTSAFGKGDKFLEFFEMELIPKINSSYRTTGYNALSGHSRGGLFVLYSLLEKPDLFNARFCYSTPAWRFNDLIVNKFSDFMKSAQMKSKTFLFISAGQNENPNIMGSFHRMNDILKKSKNKFIKSANYFTPFANHQSNPLFATSKGLVEWSKYLRL